MALPRSPAIKGICCGITTWETCSRANSAAGRANCSTRAAKKSPGNDNQLRPVLVWLDPADGHERAACALDSLQHDHPMFGPFLTTRDKLFAFAAGGENEPVRILYELTPNGQAAADFGAATAAINSRAPLRLP